jgi:hypothetical protein
MTTMLFYIIQKKITLRKDEHFSKTNYHTSYQGPTVSGPSIAPTSQGHTSTMSTMEYPSYQISSKSIETCSKVERRDGHTYTEYRYHKPTYFPYEKEVG